MKLLISVLLTASAFLSIACTRVEKQVAYEAPPADVLHSFSQTDCDKKNCLKIQKSSLGKTFLYISSAKTTTATPEWEDGRPYVVVFEKNNSQVGLFSLSLDAIYNAAEDKELMESFSIVDEDADTVTFDLGAGMKSFRHEDSFEEGDIGQQSARRTSLTVLSSFLDSIKLQNESIEIIQIAKVQQSVIKDQKENPYDDKSDSHPALETTESTFKVNIQIFPYTLNKNFKPKENDTSKTVGFFQASVAKPEIVGQMQSFIKKWDLSAAKGPLQVYVTRTTPPEYLQAVREGVWYWNRVLGFDGLQVVENADENLAPPLHSVMIRWIPWKDAGFAYASSQADPLTGELLRGQIFMTSAFAQTKGYSQKLRPVSNAPILNPMAVCDFTPSMKAFEDLSPSDPVDHRLAEDFVRDTVAHEMGHIMGLQHNFAGNSSVAITGKDILQKTEAYLTNEDLEGAMTATTVMDYISGPTEVLSARYMLQHALPYDEMAMKWAYSDDDKVLDPKVSAYCTDDDVDLAQMRDKTEIYDCRRHDPSGGGLVYYVNFSLKKRQDLLQKKYEEILTKVFPAEDKTLVNNLKRVLNENHSTLGLDELKKQVGYHKKKEGLISFEKWRNEIQRGLKSKDDDALAAMMKADLDEVGGVDGLKQALNPLKSLWTQPDLDTVLTSIQTGQGDIKGRHYQLTTDQQTQLTQYFKDEAVSIETNLQKELDEMYKDL